METEFEAKFLNIHIDKARILLQNVGAALIKPEFMQKRAVFFFPKGHEIDGGWARVRDEGNKITMSVKIVNGPKIEDQKEVCLTVNSFDQAKLFLETLGCKQKSYQETKRELWTLDGAEITIDTWPFLESFIEVEGRSEEMVKRVSRKLGFDWSEAVFGAVDVVCMKKYPHLTADRINNHTPLIIFDGENPFEK